ncbi:hypothetical protein [Streptomyces oryzae]|uniref:hypothetical protein n=1 Tax=Streptomyces oryzae TaxID=1434886 RepID=UPI001FFE0EEB|nr:hypothetical protein [Streptomyces oryzae]
MRKVAKAGVALSLVVGVSLSMGSPAQAEKRRGDRASGSAGNGKAAAEVSHVQITGGGGGGKNTVKLNPKDPNWDPPACWYEPKTTPKELKKRIDELKPEKPKKKDEDDGLILSPGADATDLSNALRGQAKNVLDNYYQADKYDDYNIDKQGEGMFWEGVRNPNKADDPKADACSEHAIWVPKGKPPKNMPLAVSPKILAEYAYEELPIPGTDISLNPQDKQTVNLDTWVWLDKGKFKPVDVTASLDLEDGTHLSATTTAKPTSLTLEPGTEDAKMYPGSGKCVVKNGQLGEEYSAGKKDRTPPCGIRYLRASGKNGSYPLKATLTWNISWKGSDGTGGDLPAGTFSETRDVTVKEIQSIVRD